MEYIYSNHVTALIGSITLIDLNSLISLIGLTGLIGRVIEIFHSQKL